MARVLTFSRVYPAYHPKAGQPTFFAEKLMAAFADVTSNQKIPDSFTDWDWYEYYNAVPKWHTIRAGNRWKKGDVFSPRIWKGQPYKKPGQQVIWSHDIEVKETFDFKIGSFGFDINGRTYNAEGDGAIEPQIELLSTVARNDGLDRHDLLSWFKFPATFSGQIICWNHLIKY